MQGLFRTQRLCLSFWQIIKKPCYTRVSASCVSCNHLLIALPNILEIFQTLPPNCLWSGNVCQITTSWEKQLCCWRRERALSLAHFRFTERFCQVWVRHNAVKWHGCACGVEKNKELQFTLAPPGMCPSRLWVSGWVWIWETKRTKLIEFIWPMHSVIYSISGMQLENIKADDPLQMFL